MHLESSQQKVVRAKQLGLVLMLRNLAVWEVMNSSILLPTRKKGCGKKDIDSGERRLMTLKDVSRIEKMHIIVIQTII